MFQGKLARLQQVSNPNSQDNFQVYCADIYLVRFLANFAGFRVFWWISRDFADLVEIRGSATARNIRSPVYYLVTWGNESILLYNNCYDHEIVIGIVCNKVEKVVKTEVLNAEYPATQINFCVAGYAVRSEGNL